MRERSRSAGPLGWVRTLIFEAICHGKSPRLYRLAWAAGGRLGGSWNARAAHSLGARLENPRPRRGQTPRLLQSNRLQERPRRVAHFLLEHRVGVELGMAGRIGLHVADVTVEL